MRQTTLRIVSGMSAALVFLAGLIPCASAQASRKPEPIGSQYSGGLINPLLPKPKFILTDTSGAAFDFFAKTQGYVTLLFFGYTHCPDMCPLQMSTIARALRQLPSGVADQLKVVFVTTDPDRDSPQVIRTWLDHFDKRFIGLTGSQQSIDAAHVAANLPLSKKHPPGPDGNYAVDHGAFILAYSRDNFAHILYPAGVNAEDWVHDLPYLTKETWAAR
jgi:protein SCO1/2